MDTGHQCLFGWQLRHCGWVEALPAAADEQLRGEPFSWPTISIAADRAAGGRAAVAFMQRVLHLSCDMMGDPSHDISDDMDSGLRRADLWSFKTLLLACYNVQHGPWSEDTRWSQVLQGLDEIFDEDSASTSPIFPVLAPSIYTDLGGTALNVDENGIDESVWEQLFFHGPWRKKYSKASMGSSGRALIQGGLRSVLPEHTRAEGCSPKLSSVGHTQVTIIWFPDGSLELSPSLRVHSVCNQARPFHQGTDCFRRRSDVVSTFRSVRECLSIVGSRGSSPSMETLYSAVLRPAPPKRSGEPSQFGDSRLCFTGGGSDRHAPRCCSACGRPQGGGHVIGVPRTRRCPLGPTRRQVVRALFVRAD